MGYTSSASFPTLNAYQATYHGGYDAFVAKLAPAGSALAYATFLGGGGTQYGNAIAVNAAGNAYVAGATTSVDFPTFHPIQATGGAFVAELSTDGRTPVYATRLGGSSYDSALGIALDAAGDAYVAGATRSADFPLRNAAQGSYGGNGDAFVDELNPAGSALVYATFLGGAGFDLAYAVAVDGTGQAYVAGVSNSNATPPGTSTQIGTFDALVAAVAPGGAGIAYSRYLGGSGTDVGTSIAADAAGNAYVAGFTASTDFPTAGPLQPGNHGGSYDAFVAKLGSPAPPTATPTLTGTATATATATATNTPTRTPTYTPIPPTATSTSTPSSTPTATATNTGTPTSTPTSSGTPTNTATSTATATGTPTNSPVATSTFTSTATATSTATGTATPSSTPPMRTLTYSYDGLQRLIGAVESPGSSYAYQYDVASNRTQVAVNGATTQQHSYDAANQVVGGTYDAAGNLTGDGSSTYSYDALGRLTAGTSGAQSSTYSYNGGGTLVGQATGGVTTGYAQDLAGGQSQVLAIATGSGANAGTVDQLWGVDRLASLNPATGVRAWYGYDGQGTARQLLNDAGHVTASANYDPYGTPEGATLPSPFGYTGELTDPATGSQYLRARWYRPGQGTLLGVDPALDSTGQPYSYASDNPANGSDPSGQCTVHLAGTEYSYLGAEGPGPCSAGLAKRIGTVFRQGDGIPCLYVTPKGQLVVLNPSQTYIFIGADSGSGKQAASMGDLAVVGGAIGGLGEATLPVTGPLAGTGPPGWVIDALIFVGVLVVGIGILVGTQATTTSTSNNGDDTCHSGRIVCFSKGADREFAVGDVAYHIERAQQRGKPIVLHYLGAAAAKRNRGKACSEKTKKTIGLPDTRNGVEYSCDEYPFAGTAEGGVNAAIAAVRRTNNDRQGDILFQFYMKEFKFQGSPNNWFVVLVIP